MRKSKDLRQKRYDKMYCKILSNNIKEAKLNNQILEPNTVEPCGKLWN